MNVPRDELMFNQLNQGNESMKRWRMIQNQYESVGFGKLKWKGKGSAKLMNEAGVKKFQNSVFYIEKYKLSFLLKS